MASVDTASGMNVAVSINYGQQTATKTGDSIIDMQGFEGGNLLVYADTLGAATAANYFTFSVYAGDESDVSDGAAIGAGDYIGTQPVLDDTATADTVL